MGVGIKLKTILRNRDMTIKSLAKLADVPLNTLYSITKRDSERVDPVILNRIATVLEVPIDYLLGTEEEQGQRHPEDTFRTAVVCAIPTRYHSEIFQKLREIGIPMEKIVRESKYGAFVGEGFIVEEITKEEQLRATNAIYEVMFRDIPHQAPGEATSTPQSTPAPQEGEDATPPTDTPETPPEGG